MLTAKAPRTSNFTKDEEQLLVFLVQKYKQIIECRRSNATTWKDKEIAWKNIEKEFNADHGKTCYRVAKHLKEKYNNLKRGAKRKFSDNKVNLIKTGGGAYTPIPYTDVDISIKEMLGDQMSGLQNTYDSDFTETGNMEETEIIVEDDHIYTQILTEESCNLTEDEPENVGTSGENLSTAIERNSETEANYNDEVKENNWSAYSSTTLKRPVSSKLLINKKDSTALFTKKTKKSILTKDKQQTKKYMPLNAQLIEEKLEFVRLQKEMFLKEHDLKMQLLNKQIEAQERALNDINN